MTRSVLSVVVGVVVACAFASVAVSAQAQRKTETYPDSPEGFGKCGQRIESCQGRNLLARKGVKVVTSGVDAHVLTDGLAGQRGGDGRANVGGHPTVITFYLGQVKPIHEVGMYTFNGDARANQDFEVRLADNSANPGSVGKMPKFPEAAALTTGDKVIGPGGGGCHTSFAAPDGSALAQADWVEFRIWGTYGVAAGQPARKDQGGWSAVIELEVLGDPTDAIVISPEELARRKELDKRGTAVPYEKKATWWDTMAASREALLAWECELDGLVLQRAGVTMGPWHTVGALPAGGPAASAVERLRKIDLAAGVPVKDAQPLQWRKVSDLPDGKLADLAKAVGGKGGEVIYLCRQVTLDTAYQGSDSFVLGLGMRAGSARLAEGNSRFDVRRDSTGAAPTAQAVPNQWPWALRDAPGTYHLLAALPVGADGKCELWFMPQPPMAQPGAGNANSRTGRRRDLFRQVERDFTDALSRMQMFWEKQDSIWVRFERRAMAGREYFPSDWVPGNPAFLADQYSRFAAERAAAAAKEAPQLEPAIAARAMPWIKQFLAAAGAAGAGAKDATVAAARERYYSVATVQFAMAEHHRIESMRLAVIDQRDTFGDRYPKAAEYLQRVAELAKAMDAVWPKVLSGGGAALGELLALRQRISAESGEILLDNPVLKFDKLLLGKGGPGFASNWGGANHIGGEIVTLSPVRPDGKIETVHKGGSISDMDLSFDAKKILFCDASHVHEVNVDGTGHRQITNQTDQHVKHYDATRMPSGQILFASTACEQAVPCTGEWYVGNLHVMDADGKNERRLTFDQDHDWNPCVLNNGQVVYTRWEYTDIPHYFSRLLFTMNPDGTAQMEYYGSNSYWPNAMYWARPIPGHPTRVVCVVSGHHGVSRVGQLVILDNAQGRQEADGVVQRILERGRKVEPVIEDGLVAEWWPRFAWPWPLGERPPAAPGGSPLGAGPSAPLGAGKYFLVNCQPDEWSPWGVYLVDVFDNLTPILIGSYAEPIPLVPRPTPPVIPSRVDTQRKDALVYMVDVTKGGGLAGYPAGAVKALRIGAHEYRFGGNGDTYAASYEGGWDIKRILGTVPVEADGSAYFRVPANTPIFVQPLDADGRALQTMRSWLTAMPGEVLSCVGCHERQSLTPGVGKTLAASKPPAEIAPWFGPTRGFSFDSEVQPVLDRRCAGCHDGGKGDNGPDFRARSLHAGYKGNYSPAYLALAKYVRRAGYEADYHLAAPSEWAADTSPLVQLLLKGHNNVKLSREEWSRIYAWIDFNVPYAANWRQSHQPPTEEQVARRARYKQLYAGLSDVDEAVAAAPAVGKFDPPQPETEAEGPGAPRKKLDGWPMSPDQAAAAQKASGLGDRVLDLGRAAAMPLVAIPAGRFVMGDPDGAPDERRQCVVAIDQTFYMARFEVTNRQYSLFDPMHDSAYMDARGKDRYTRGYPVNDPNQPVIRISWHQAMAFCRWLSTRTGMDCTLPTEAEWEYACRAGAASAWPFGDKLEALRDVANVADSSLGGWSFGRITQGYNDGAMFTVPPGRYKPNAWGLHDMIGNVAEWTRSDYRPYPYVDADGRNNPPNLADPAPARKVVRGGSWYSTMPHARSASRWGYPPHQPVFDVGFRVVARPVKVAKW